MGTIVQGEIICSTLPGKLTIGRFDEGDMYGKVLSRFKSPKEARDTYLKLKSNPHPLVSDSYPPTQIRGVYHLPWRPAGRNLDEIEGFSVKDGVRTSVFIRQGHLISDFYLDIIGALFGGLKYMLQNNLTWEPSLENIYVDKDECANKILLVGFKIGELNLAEGLKQIADLVVLINQKSEYDGGKNTEMATFLDYLNQGDALLGLERIFCRLPLLQSLNDRIHIICKLTNKVKKQKLLSQLMWIEWPEMFPDFVATIQSNDKLKKLRANCGDSFPLAGPNGTQSLTANQIKWFGNLPHLRGLCLCRKGYRHYYSNNTDLGRSLGPTIDSLQTGIENATQVVLLFEENFPNMMPKIMEFIDLIEGHEAATFVPEKDYIKNLLEWARLPK